MLNFRNFAKYGGLQIREVKSPRNRNFLSNLNLRRSGRLLLRLASSRTSAMQLGERDRKLRLEHEYSILANFVLHFWHQEHPLLRDWTVFGLLLAFVFVPDSGHHC